MKIGVIVDNELNNDKRVLREIRILKDAGHEVSVLCFGFRKMYADPVEGVEIRRIRISRKLKDILFFFSNFIPAYEWLWSSRIRKFIRDFSPEILHVHDLYMSKAGHRGIEKSGRKVHMILDLHENYAFEVTTYNWTKGFLRNLFSRPYSWQKKEEEYLLYADALIVLSEEFRDTLIGKYPHLSAKKFIALPNVPDLTEQGVGVHGPPAVSFSKDTFVVLYFGIVAERRGIFDVLEVFRMLAEENKPVVFLVIGPVDKKDMLKFSGMINSGPLRQKVRYIPWIDLSELPSYLDICGACIAPFKKNPQHESGIANKIFDYMLGKKPVIASDCRPQKNLIEKYKCGIVYAYNPGMKDAIIRLSGDPELCRRLGENGYKAILNEYNTDITKSDLLNLYSTLK
jgi:glycosyltransferase involved in cell wall biosynthesis